MNKIDSQTIWQGFHWSFFINTQGLIVCLRRFEMYMAMNEISLAEIELKTATDLMEASSASMILAGSFSKQEYETNVRTMMTPPNVKSKDFSGLMSWEHAVLVQLWKRLRPVFVNLPDSLQAPHQEFINAYRNLAKSHKSVCEKFGGNETGSLRFEGNNALKTLDKFSHSREQLINPTNSLVVHR